MRRSGLLVLALLGAGFALPAEAAPSAREAIIRSCQQQMYMSAAACACLADKAMAELDPLEQTWLSLGATDVAHSSPISKQMTAAQAHRVDAFMRTVPDQCSGRQAAR